MNNVRQMKARVQAAIKRVDSTVTTGTFYDDASDRMFVTIVKGPRKISVTLRGRDFTNGLEKINQALEAGLKRLETTPIG